jgi:thioredoxin reductase
MALPSLVEASSTRVLIVILLLTLAYEGAVGVEIAAELKTEYPNQIVRLIHSRQELLSSEPLPDDFKSCTLSALREIGVDVLLGSRVVGTTASESDDGSKIFNLKLAGGKHIQAGHVISATSGSIPSTSFLPDEVLDENGYVKVRARYSTSVATLRAQSQLILLQLELPRPRSKLERPFRRW